MFFAIITLAIVLLSPKFSDAGERFIEVNVGVGIKYSCLVRVGDGGWGVGAFSTVRIACAKSSSVVSSEQSTTACESPKTLDAT